MRAIFGSIWFLLSAVLCLCGASGCSDRADGEGGSADNVLLVLHIRPLEGSAPSVAPTVTEKIRSLRVVMLNEQNGSSRVEYNKLVSLDAQAAGEFRYEFATQTVAGTKSFYIIANEESVTALQYEGSGLPADLPTNLTALLDRYGVDASGAEFKRAMEAAHFAPAYTIAGGDIYLPYTTCYRGIEVGSLSAVEGPTMYLIPVATKFFYTFLNNRDNDVEVSRIDVSRTDSHNFLMAQVADSEQQKVFAADSKSYYWIDWLAKVSEASHANGSYDNNVPFNEKYGWIANYGLPAASVQREAQMLGGETVTIPAGSRGADNKVTAGQLTLGPFYYPESRNCWDADKDEMLDEQIYNLSLGLHDVKSLPGEDPYFEHIPIANVKTLFRNTCVLIKVTLNQGDVDVYAEIVDWDRNRAYGWVIEK